MKPRYELKNFVSEILQFSVLITLFHSISFAAACYSDQNKNQLL